MSSSPFTVAVWPLPVVSSIRKASPAVKVTMEPSLAAPSSSPDSTMSNCRRGARIVIGRKLNLGFLEMAFAVFIGVKSKILHSKSPIVPPKYIATSGNTASGTGQSGSAPMRDIVKAVRL
jgi:hypothetical protein